MGIIMPGTLPFASDLGLGVTGDSLATCNDEATPFGFGAEDAFGMEGAGA